MKKGTAKFIVLGLDGAIPWIIQEGMRKGFLNNFKFLKKKGVFTPVLPSPSSVTPGNWAAIATGAPCGKIGISDFAVHIPGEAFEKPRNAFHRDICGAEFIWDTLSKKRMRTATISYPGSRPRGLQGHTVIGGSGAPSEGTGYCALDKAQCFITPDIRLADPYNWKEHKTIRLKPAGDSWANLPRDLKSPREFSFSVLGNECLCLLYKTRGKDMVAISRKRDFNKVLSKAGEKQWSGWIRLKVNTAEAVFRARPIRADSRRNSLQLYLSPVNRLRQFSKPAVHGNKLYSCLGVYQEPLNISALVTGWLDPKGLLDEFREQAMWQAKAVVELTKNMGFSGVLSKWHAFDKFYHFFFQKIDPISPFFDKKEFGYYENIHRKILEIADDMVGYVLKEQDENTMLAVCSDHGLIPSARHASVPNFLTKHGFTVLKQNSAGDTEIDWRKTKAVLHPFVQIWVNLKGRDPCGIVKPGAEYEKVRNDIIKLLRQWKYSKTGEYVMSHVFKTEDGAFYGLGGERDGDIRFFTTPGYSVYRDIHPTKNGILIKDAVGPYLGDHGSCEPTARFGRGSETAILALYGAGVKPGFVPEIYPRLIDIIPTICHLCNLPVPANSEGGVLYDFMADRK